MIITTKPVMAFLALLILCALVANCVEGVMIDCFTAKSEKCDVPTDKGVLLFTVKKGAHVRTTDITVPNLKIDKDGLVTLNMTIQGATLDETKEITNDNIWNLYFSDTDTAPGTMTVSVASGVTINNFFWPGSKKATAAREVCFHMGTDQSWYNTFEQKTQRWPMDLTKGIDSFPLNAIPLDTNSEIEFIVEHLFLSSKGFAILLERDLPLWFRIVPSATDPLMCVTARNNRPYDAKNAKPEYTNIKFSIYTGENIVEVFDAVSNKLGSIPKPANTQDDFMLLNPVWSLISGKGKFFTDVELSQDNVLKFADALKNHEYPSNMLLLETDWEMESSFLAFNQAKFLTPKDMMKAIHGNGSRLNLLVHPYVRSDSSVYTNRKELFVKDKLGSDGLLIRSGQYKDRCIVDFSNPKARKWFKDELVTLKNTSGVDSFVFNSIAFSDNEFTLFSSFIQNDPVKFVEEYVIEAATFGAQSIVRDGHRTQGQTLYTQMSDRVSDWSYQKGLKSLIPTALAMSIGGYSFILPDIIGGRTGEKPSKQLYIRWAQAVTFFPTMQFAIPPWDYDDETEEIVKDLVGLHSKGPFVNLANKRKRDGTPIMRPMWFVAPNEPDAYKIDDQFMLGDDLLVAPVLEEDAEVRTVFFPLGKWQDQNNAATSPFSGPITVEVKAPLKVLPHFKKLP